MQINYKTVLQQSYRGIRFYVKGPEDEYESIHFLDEEDRKSKADLDARWLDVYKHQRCVEIDIRTQELFQNGFEWDNEIFSLSTNAQTNWVALNSVRDELQYPVEVSTLHDGSYSLPDEATLHLFCMTALGTGQAVYNSGRLLKQQINACGNDDEVEAIIDPR